MTEQIRIIPHSPEGILDTGSFEVVWPGGKRYIYWDENVGRRAITRNLSRAEALEQAKSLTRDKRFDERRRLSGGLSGQKSQTERSKTAPQTARSFQCRQ